MRRNYVKDTVDELLFITTPQYDNCGSYGRYSEDYDDDRDGGFGEDDDDNKHVDVKVPARTTTTTKMSSSRFCQR